MSLVQSYRRMAAGGVFALPGLDLRTDASACVRVHEHEQLARLLQPRTHGACSHHGPYQALPECFGMRFAPQGERAGAGLGSEAGEQCKWAGAARALAGFWLKRRASKQVVHDGRHRVYLCECRL